MMNDDMALMQDYAAGQSAQAFETLVSRHAGLVHSAAIRQVRDPHLAEEITQTVFIILARKAGSLSPKTVLPGWLYRTTRYVSSAALKMRRRRERHEQEAQMQPIAETSTDAHWEQLSPLLDEAMARLRARDRDAIVLRYFKNKSLHDVGAALGVSKFAAQKRVDRAVEKLRTIFGRLGIHSSTAAIAETVSAHSVQAVPSELARSLAVVAISKGSIATASTLTLLQSSMKLMTWLKIKLTLGIAAAVLVATTATIALSQMTPTPHNQTAVTNNPPNGVPQILIAAAFVKIPTSDIDALLKAFSAPQVPTQPNSIGFRNFIKQHTGAEVIAAPRIVTIDGMLAEISQIQSVEINGTNANAGVTLKVTPTVRPGVGVDLQVHYELIEKVDEPAPHLRVTAGDETVHLTKNRLAMLRMAIGGDNSDQTLLVFINGGQVQQRLQQLIKRAP